jgi:hypothetical protein
VIGGVAVSTLLTLFVVPSAYVLMRNGGDRLGAWLTRSRPAESVPDAPAEPA